MIKFKTLNFSRFFLTVGIILAALSSLSSCKKVSSENERQATTETEDTEYYHADNDIAMTIRSMVDCINVGEALDSTVYNYVGILTDGEGKPLYTDSEYYPGQWEVLVVESDSAIVRNLKSGDLRVYDLQRYIAENLDLSESSILASEDIDNDNLIELTTYAFEGGKLRFEILEENTPLDEEGPFLNISISKN